MFLVQNVFTFFIVYQDYGYSNYNEIVNLVVSESGLELFYL